MNIKVGQEVLDCVDAIDDALGFLTEPERGVLVQAMQSLINSTIERCAAVAENGWVPAYVVIPEGGLKGDWQPGSPWDRGAVDACQKVATAIRQMKGSANV